MMQHVATTKSEIAAFATGTGSNSISGTDSNEQFGKLLQDQNSPNSFAAKSDGPPPHSPRKLMLQQSLDEMEKAPISADKESKKLQQKNTSNELIEIQDAHKSSSSQHKTAVQSATQDNAADNSLEGHGEVNGELEVANTEAELLLTSKQNDFEADNNDAQEWVTLVDNLQKLVDISRLTNTPSVDSEVESLDVLADELILSQKVAQDLLELSADSEMPEPLQTGFVDDENVSKDDLGSLAAKEENQASLAILIQQALEKLSAEGDTGQESSNDIQQKTAELLLAQPEVLQSLLNQLQNVSQKNGSDTAEQKTLDTTIDNVIKKDSALANQQIETNGQVDLTLGENKALLSTLLDGSELDGSEINKNGVQETVKSAKPVFSDAPEKLVQAQQVETLLPKLGSVSEQDDILEQDVHVAPNNSLNSNKTEKVANNNDIKNILNLSDNKLDKVLENIAQRVFDTKNTNETISPEQLAQQAVMPKTTEITNLVGSSSKDFIAELKSSLEEFKSQLSQGREPGMDLKALVADALAKTTDTSVVSKAPVNLEQALNNVSQLLDFAQTMNRAIEHHHDQTYSASLRDVAQIQGEQSKQIQLNQFESKFDKAINIAKPEGHQQLAEKVRWMVNTKNLVAEIRLDPAELGSVHVKVAVSGESATVNFVVQSQLARDAVDNATPRLREMLAEKGIELGQSSVRQESDGQQGQGDGEFSGQGGSGNEELENLEGPEQVLAQQNIVNGALGGIDYFV
ncbi:flagellar hook-length control protein FliK [Paraglaciecola arctica]|uniref:Flagellar hook-length control protein FliK n=1 Tax=Paraglaciecola arctica BSs20135 TaxID=493475 RepID=K6Z5N4_9ALTE|nr:flagellar hook-length control protein FliK [Paraglaciecola arctica]GAC18750.1 flagellar hook-length control protein FliK [Paraglaciecola arctica BSs20135]